MWHPPPTSFEQPAQRSPGPQDALWLGCPFATLAQLEYADSRKGFHPNLANNVFYGSRCRCRLHSGMANRQGVATLSGALT